MIEQFNVNSFAEALFYYLGKANNEDVKVRLEKAIKAHPECKKQLKKITAPAFALEKLLDSRLHANDKLVDKYFKKFEGSGNLPPFGNCLAFLMIYSTVLYNTNVSADEMYEILIGSDAQDGLSSLVIGLMYRYNTERYKKTSIEELARKVENLDISYKDKWAILDIILSYHLRLEELLSVLLPAAKLIEASESEYKNVIKEFHNFYSETNIKTFLEAYSIPNNKINISDTVKITPLILGFDNINSITESKTVDDVSSDNPKTRFFATRMIIGISIHLMTRSAQDNIPSLSDKLKTLSDNTRLEMLFYLCSHKAYGQELSDKFGIQRSTVSYHVAKLIEAGFVNYEIICGRTYYTADKAGIQRMLDAFAEKIK